MFEQIIIEETKGFSRQILNKTDTSIILDTVDFGQIKGEQISVKYVNQIGETVVNTNLNTRDTTITGWVTGLSDEEFKANKSILNRMITPSIPLNIYAGDYVIQMYPDSTVKYAISEEENNEVMCKFQITGYCPDPLFKNVNKNNIVISGVKPTFMFPLILKPNGIQMGTLPNGYLFNVTNAGEIETGFELEIIAKGTVSNPAIVNVYTSEVLKINKTLVVGEKIIINTNRGSRKITGYLGEEVLNYAKYRDRGSSWIQLALGINFFRYFADTNQDLLEVNMYFDSKYWEVQT